MEYTLYSAFMPGFISNYPVEKQSNLPLIDEPFRENTGLLVMDTKYLYLYELQIPLFQRQEL